jgi:integrase
MLDVTEFLKDRGFPATTRRAYSDVLRVVLTHFEGHDLGSVSLTDFLALGELRAWKPATTRLAHMALRSYLRWLGAESALALTWKTPRARSTPQRTLSIEDKARLLSACRSTASGKQLAIIIEVLWGTWLRASELCNARLDKLDLRPGREMLTVKGKGGEWRDVAITAYVASLIEAWIRIERASIPGAPGCPTIFVTSSGSSWTRESLRTMLHRLGQSTGVPVSPHDFRRGACTDALRKGMSSRMAQLQGRWSDLDQVERYSQALDVDDVRQALERVA